LLSIVILQQFPSGDFNIISEPISVTCKSPPLIVNFEVGVEVPTPILPGIMIAHTHPSGNLKPSNADINMTYKLKEAAKLMDIRLLDHLIISTEGYYSFADNGEF
jgi:hypothetical protein